MGKFTSKKALFDMLMDGGSVVVKQTNHDLIRRDFAVYKTMFNADSLRYQTELDIEQLPGAIRLSTAIVVNKVCE